jgi:hypothetical protein
MGVVILKRDYKDEKIEVTVSMPNLEGGEGGQSLMTKMVMMKMLARMMKEKKMMRVPEIAAFP